MKRLATTLTLTAFLLLACLALIQPVAAGGGDGGGNKQIYGCTRTFGYWQTHHCRAGKREDSPLRLSWPLTDPDQPCLNEDYERVCGLSGLQWYELGEGEYGMRASLAHQLIAAELNVESGASTTDQAVADIERAYELLGQHCNFSVALPDTVRTEMEEIKSRLDAYNNGNAPGGPPHCDDGGEPPCYVSEWSEWSACSLPCGNGTQTRERYIHCPDYKSVDREERPCNEQPCCEVGEWGAWSTCEGDCGPDGGSQTRTRSVACDPSVPYPPESRQTRPCDTGEPCCEVGEWGAWSNCSVICAGQGEGTRTRSRTVTCEGHEPRNETDTESCSDDCPCCTTSAWTPWSACNATCGGGGGVQTRYQTTTCLPDSGEEDGVQDESRVCNDTPCPCLVENCDQCSEDGTTCLDCEDGYYDHWPHDGRHCKPCPEECLASPSSL